MRSNVTISAAAGRTVAGLLKARGLEQKTFADALGVSEGYVSRLLTGQRDMTFGLLLKSAEFLDVPVQELAPGCGDDLAVTLKRLEPNLSIGQARVLHAVARYLQAIDGDQADALEVTIRSFAGAQ